MDRFEPIRALWRQAALMNVPQFRGVSMTSRRDCYSGGTVWSHCGVTLVRESDFAHLLELPQRDLSCPVMGCDYPHGGYTPWDLIVHLNNHHEWTWLDLANKLPEIS